MAGAAIEKGVAFPVCVSVNDVICNNSPLASQEMVSSGHLSVENVSDLSLRIATLTLPSPYSLNCHNRNHSLLGILLNWILDVISMDI